MNRLSTDKITIQKKDGSKIESIKSSLQKNRLYILDSDNRGLTYALEVDDLIMRNVRGILETYKITNPNYLSSKGRLSGYQAYIEPCVNPSHDTAAIESDQSNSPMNKIFISHSSKDFKYVEELIEILELIGVEREQIFCSSVAGHGVDLGSDIFERIKQEISGDTTLIYVLSNNFFSSPVCLCEMGAAWVLTKTQIPILIPPFNYSDIKGVLSPSISSAKLNRPLDISSLKEKIETIFQIENKINTSNWEHRRDKILKRIEQHITDDSETAENSRQSSEPTALSQPQDFITVDSKKKICEKDDIIIGFLPRGYVLLENISFSSHSSWSVCLNYYEYGDNALLGTHYHKSYGHEWLDLDIQARKVGVPLADYDYLYPFLELMISLRKQKEGDSPDKILAKELKNHEFEAMKLEAGHEFEITSVPRKYTWYYKTGLIRDLLKELKNLNVAESSRPFEDLDEIKRAICIELDSFGELEGKKAMKYVEQIHDELKLGMSRENYVVWDRRFFDAVNSCLKIIK